jgi:hypothetical protein
MAFSPDGMLSSMAFRDAASAWSAMYLQLCSITGIDVYA